MFGGGKRPHMPASLWTAHNTGEELGVELSSWDLQFITVSHKKRRLAENPQSWRSSNKAVHIIVIIIVIVVIITRNAVLSHNSKLSLLPHEEQASNTCQRKAVPHSTTQLHRKIALSKSFRKVCEEIPESHISKEKKTTSSFRQQMEVWEALSFFQGFKFKSSCVRFKHIPPKKKTRERKTYSTHCVSNSHYTPGAR